MAAGQGGLLWALLIFGIIHRLAPRLITNNEETRMNPCKLDYCSSNKDISTLKCEYVLKKLCPDPAANTKMAGERKNTTKAITVTVNFPKYIFIILILLSGDVAQNPGPIQFPCGLCSKSVRKNQRGIQCEDCLYWHHIKCINMPTPEYDRLSNSYESWFCNLCSFPRFNDSFFEISIDNNESKSADCDDLPCRLSDISGKNVNKVEWDVFEDLTKVKRSFPRNFICGYLNINSLRYKHEYIKDLLHRNLIDLLFLSETKIDASFPDAQFTVNNFTMYRSDRNQYGGGIISYVRSDLAVDRKDI